MRRRAAALPVPAPGLVFPGAGVTGGIYTTTGEGAGDGDGEGVGDGGITGGVEVEVGGGVLIGGVVVADKDKVVNVKFPEETLLPKESTEVTLKL